MVLPNGHWYKDCNKFRKGYIDKLQFSHPCDENKEWGLEEMKIHIKENCPLNRQLKCEKCQDQKLMTA